LHEYDLPTPRTIVRFIYADGDGNIWFPNNSNNKIGVIVQQPPQQPEPIGRNLDSGKLFDSSSTTSEVIGHLGSI
jgi:hypothetical protein